MAFESLALIAHLDGVDDPKRIVNPIHSSDEAKKLGFEGALVGGIVIYGWALPCILKVLGDRWLSDGYCEVNYKAPIYPGDEVTVRVAKKPSSSNESRDHAYAISRKTTDGKIVDCVVGVCGVGKASWYKEIQTSSPSEECDSRTTVELSDNGMISLAKDGGAFSLATAKQAHKQSLPPYVNRTRARYLQEWYATRIAPSQRAWFDGLRVHYQGKNYPILHPCVFISGRATPLLHHAFDYTTSIHTQTKIQHLSPPTAAAAADNNNDDGDYYAEQDGLVLVSGKVVNVYEKKGKEYVDAHVQVFVIERDPASNRLIKREIARMMHTEILKIHAKM